MKTKVEAIAREWLRKYDALIAERAEGRTVYKGNDCTGNPYDLYWVHVEPNGSGQCPVPVPHYNTDLAAAARAMEAWRLQEPDYRAWAIESHEGQIDAECRDWEKRYRGHSETGDIPHACASALLRALGGGE